MPSQHILILDDEPKIVDLVKVTSKTKPLAKLALVARLWQWRAG